MTDGWPLSGYSVDAYRLRPLRKGFARRKTTDLNRALLTVPLLCALCRPWFESEGANQVEGSSAQVEMMQRRPQVDHVSLLATARVEAGEDIVLQIDTE